MTVSPESQFKVIFLNDGGITERRYDTLRQAQPAAVGVRSGRSESRIATLLVKPDGTTSPNFNPNLTERQREIAAERLHVASCGDICKVAQPKTPVKKGEDLDFQPTQRELEIITNLTELCKFTVVLGGFAETYDDATGVCATEHMDHIIGLSKDIVAGELSQEDAIHQFVKSVFKDVTDGDVYTNDTESFTTHKPKHTPNPLSRRKITDDMVVGGRRQEPTRIPPPTQKTTRGSSKPNPKHETTEVFDFDVYEPVRGETLAERQRKAIEKQKQMKKFLRTQPPMKLVTKQESGVQIFFNEESRSRIHNIMAHLLGISPHRYVMFGEPFDDPEFPDFTHVLMLDMTREKKYGQVGEWVVSGGRIPVAQLETKINGSAFRPDEAHLLVLYPEDDYELAENEGL